jgi:hypothetical protein
MIKPCQWCDNTFETKISYQIYCSDLCREEATREKIAQRYIQSRRLKRVGKERKCKQCGTNLSIYNDDSICLKCDVNPSDVTKALKDIKGLANGKDKSDKS